MRADNWVDAHPELYPETKMDTKIPKDDSGIEYPETAALNNIANEMFELSEEEKKKQLWEKVKRMQAESDWLGLNPRRWKLKKEQPGFFKRIIDSKLKENENKG